MLRTLLIAGIGVILVGLAGITGVARPPRRFLADAAP